MHRDASRDPATGFHSSTYSSKEPQAGSIVFIVFVSSVCLFETPVTSMDLCWLPLSEVRRLDPRLDPCVPSPIALAIYTTCIETFNERCVILLIDQGIQDYEPIF